MNYRLSRAHFLSITFTLLGVSSCALPPTKPWHLATRDTEIYVSFDLPQGTSKTTVLTPPRGPEASYSAVRTIRVGDRGERIYEITKPHYPHYTTNGALLTTHIHGQTYEVGYLYRPDGSGIIADISYWPISENAPQ